MVRRMVTAALLVAAYVAVGQSLTAESTEGPKGWITDYNQARRESERLGLPLLVHFHASWCGPCAQMERETLNSPEVLRQLGTRFIGVKIDNDDDFELVKAFRVDSLPSDIVVAPDGRIVSRRTGYQTSASYVGALSQWGGAFSKERTEALARLQPAPSVTSPFRSSPQVTQAAPQPAVPPRTPQQTAPIVSPPAQEKLLIGLGGYSPVAVKSNKQWIEGRREFAMTYQGVAYFMADASEYQLFQANPERYTPRLLGCDPVELMHSERAVPGSVEFGAFFGGELYLFGSLDSRNRFKRDPEHYTRVRTVVRADDIIGTRLR